MDLKRILACEDDEDSLEIITRILSSNNFTIIQAVTGTECFEKSKGSPPDLFLLDINLPDMNGLDICRKLKADPATHHIPIIMLTARTKEHDMVLGLESGADDYIPKPIRPAILLARVRAVLRRQEVGPAESHVHTAGDLTIDIDKRKCFIRGAEITLRAKEFDVLVYLARSHGRVVTRQAIYESVWGYEYTGMGRTVDTTVYNLRKKLGPEADRIKSVPPYGYQFEG